MPTALSSTEVTRAQVWRRRRVEALRSASDLRHLVGFRAAAVPGRSRRVVGASLGVMVLLTVAAAWLPAHLPGAAGSPAAGPLRSDDVVELLPSAYLGALLISVVSAALSGGGRELLPRDQAIAFPVSPTTDHLGALLMAPLNIAWLLQSWTVLAASAFAFGPQNLLAVQVPVLVWLAAATALAQVVAWAVEWVRRSRRGPWMVRVLALVLVAGAGAVVIAGSALTLLDRSPTEQVVLAAAAGSEGRWLPWSYRVVLLLAGWLLAIAAGAWLAHVLARRPVREEVRIESALRPPRTAPASDLAAVLRADRVGIWRSVPMRRGFTFLAVLPGLVAVASALDWSMVTILPGLVVSGAALLFGVNAWCLDGRGALWRESLPVSPRLAFWARVVVLSEVLVGSAGLVIVLAALRAGPPSAAQVAAVLCVTPVVTLQVLSGAMRWSVRRPFAVDLRSARATPAPPLTMVGYSTRFALVTTCTSMLFVTAAQAPSWTWPVVLAVPFLLFSLVRLSRTAAAWQDAEIRSLVVRTVAG